MSSVAAPFGLRPIGRHDTGSLEVFRQYPIASAYGTNIAMGDIVHLVDGGTATTIEKQAGVGTSAIDIVGIFLGCKYTDPNTKQVTFSQLWPASTVASDAMAYVVDNPDVEFVITDNNPFYSHVLSALNAGGNLRVWFKPTDNSTMIYQLSQNNKIVAPFDKLVYINGYSGSGAAAIPILLAIVFVFSWYRKSGT